LLSSAVLIVRPVIGSVNISGGNSGLVASSAKPEGDPMPPPSGRPGERKPLTIAEAKKALAATFGVKPEDVEITIRG